MAAAAAVPAEDQGAYAVDCEFIQVAGHGGELQKVVCSIGVVDDRLEKILYARVKKPMGSVVMDDSFVRTRGGLNPDWDKGIHIFVANNLLKAFCEQGGLLVGWQLESDLKALGLTEAGVLAADAEGHPPYGRRMGLPIGTPAHPVDANIVELTDVYRTAEHGAKCTLAEAYTAVFTRTMSAHDAADDAAMTMELYRYWRDAGSPDRISIAVAFHVVNAHTFAPDRRSELLWRFLRPTRRDRDVVIERDDGENVFQLKFRRLADRDAFVTELRRRVREDGPPHGVWWGQEVPGEPQGSVQVNCGAFRIHLFEQLR